MANAVHANQEGRGEAQPSRWTERAVVLVLALLGLTIASYLTAYQLGRVDAPWDPIFGSASSSRVMHSALTRLISPVPDAGMGTIGYLVEIVLVIVGGSERWRTQPYLVLLYGLTVAGMALVSLALVLMQAFVVRSGCSLCLCSALISFVNAALAQSEVRASLALVRGRYTSETTPQAAPNTSSRSRAV